MKNFKKIAFGFVVGAIAIGFSAFTNAKKHFAAGDYAFYNTSGVIHDSNPANYVFRSASSSASCLSQGTVCQETWNIGASTPTPADGTLLSTYSTKIYKADVVTGTYNP